MEATNILLVDDNELLAGSVGKYLKDRFGKGISVQTIRGARHHIAVTEKGSVIMVLDYSLNGNSGLKSKDRVEEIKEQNPLADVVVLPAPGKVENDIVGTVKTIEKDAASYIMHHGLNPVKAIELPANKADVSVAPVPAQENTLAALFSMFLIFSTATVLWIWLFLY